MKTFYQSPSFKASRTLTKLTDIHSIDPEPSLFQGGKGDSKSSPKTASASGDRMCHLLPPRLARGSSSRGGLSFVYRLTFGGRASLRAVRPRPEHVGDRRYAELTRAMIGDDICDLKKDRGRPIVNGILTTDKRCRFFRAVYGMLYRDR